MCVQPPGIYSFLAGVNIHVMTKSIHTVCGDPSENLPVNASISSLNGSVVTFSCDPGYSLHGSTTSQCVSGEWTPSPETVICVTMNTPIPSEDQVNTVLASSAPTPGPMGSDDNSTRGPLSTAEAVAITAIVCVLCSFTAGLVLGALLTRYSVCCHRSEKRVQTAGSSEKGAGIELKNNEAYEYVPH